MERGREEDEEREDDTSSVVVGGEHLHWNSGQSAEVVTSEGRSYES